MDQSLFHLINEEWTSPALDLFMAALSNGEIWKPLFIAIALAALLFGGFRGRAFIVCLLLALAVTEPVTATLKAAFDRHRPKQVERARRFSHFSKPRSSVFPINPTETVPGRHFHRVTW